MVPDTTPRFTFDEWLNTLKPSRRKAVKWTVRQLRKQGWEIRRALPRKHPDADEYTFVCYREDMVG